MDEPEPESIDQFVEWLDRQDMDEVRILFDGGQRWNPKVSVKYEIVRGRLLRHDQRSRSRAARWSKMDAWSKMAIRTIAIATATIAIVSAIRHFLHR